MTRVTVRDLPLRRLLPVVTVVETTNTLVVPADHRVGFDDGQGLFPARPEP
jgi:hypothetical protein